MDNKKTRCSVCGAQMKTSFNKKTGKPFDVQMCCDTCMMKAFRIVCEALKKGVRPEFFGSRLKDVKQKRGKNLTPEERHKIVRMYIEGMSQAQIARILGKSPSLINKVIKREWEAHKW